MQEINRHDHIINPKNILMERNNVCDKLQLLLESGDKSYSVEVCSNGDISPYDLLKLDPLFYSTTFSYENEHYELMNKKAKRNAALLLASKLIRNRRDVLLHLPFRYFSKKTVHEILISARNKGVRNILVKKGDTRSLANFNAEDADFQSVNDVIIFIRQHFGNLFYIGVLGYPSHFNLSRSVDGDLKHLKQNVDSGANFIICQASFDASTFQDFYRKCSSSDIKVPLIPSVVIVDSYNSLIHITEKCRTKASLDLIQMFESTKHNKLTLRNLSIHHCVSLIKTFFNDKSCPVSNVFIFTLNRLKMARKITEQLGFAKRINRPLHVTNYRIDKHLTELKIDVDE